MTDHQINIEPGASFERVVDALRAAGIEVQRYHGGGKARCPLAGHKHGDRNPSLAVQYVPALKRTRLRCHLPAHRDRDVDLLESIGLGVADLFDEPMTRKDRDTRGAWKPSTSKHKATTRTSGAGRPNKAEQTAAEDVASAVEKPADAPVTELAEVASFPEERGAAVDEAAAEVKPAVISPSAGAAAVVFSEAEPAPGPVAEPPVKKERTRRRVVANYDYTDAAGAPVLRVLRYEPKGFSQQKWDGARWVRGGAAVPERVLYRLPQVLAAAEAGATVHVCEGEKDAEAVAPVLTGGAVATTAAGGADKWLPQYTEQLAGAGLVVIWRDKDDSGTAQVRTLAAALEEAGLKTLVVEALEGKDAADHLAAGHTLDEAVPVDLEPETPVQDEPALGEKDVPEAGGPVKAWNLPAPEHEIPMGRGTWAYEYGGPDRRRRGLWTRSEEHWQWVAPLPFVHARIAQRDGSGRRTATAYLLSAAQEGPRVVITHDNLRTAAWANMLGLALSADDRITKAATTAIIYAAEHVQEQEETPRVVAGKITIPSPETLPVGYLQTSDHTVEEARTGWATLIGLVAQSPKMALVVGASAIAPFVAATRRQSHFIDIYGDASQGKSVAMNTAGAVWGFSSAAPEDDGVKVVTTFNASAQGPSRVLGELGVLPPFFDEIGQAPYQGPQQWGKFVFDVCEGNRRTTPGQRGAQTHYGRPWHGIFFAAGNGRLLDGLGAGRYAGVNRRVIELSVPMTLDRAHATAIEEQWQTVYGHAGLALLQDHSVETVRPYIAEAAAALEAPTSAVGANVAEHLYSHIAGAALLDAWAGTGTTLRDAATVAAAEYLETWAEPEHDADRMLGAIRDAIGREPAMWPTLAVYQANRRPAPAWNIDAPNEKDSVIPRHGVDRSLSGLRDDDNGWVAVFSHTWRGVCAELGLDAAVAASELHSRGVLTVPEGRRRRGEWVTQVRASGTGMYRLVLPVVADEDDLPAGETDTPPALSIPETDPVVGETEPCSGSVVGGVVGANSPLTCDVVGVVGVVDKKPHVRAYTRDTITTRANPALVPLKTPQPCTVCRTPAQHAVDDHPIHTGQCLVDWTEGYQRPSPTSVDQLDPDLAPRAAPIQRKERFQAPAAVVDGSSAYLPRGLVVPIGPLRHLGDLAELVHPDVLALGHGGDAERLPDLGQVWVTATTLEAMGLPTDLPSEDKPRDKALAALAQSPALAEATGAGWQLGQGGRMREWTRIWHRERLPHGAWIVVLPWQRLAGVGLVQDDPDPAELANRLAEFAHQVGISYRLSPATTGLDLIDHTRPPVKAGEEEHATRVSVRRGEPAELPGWLRKVDDTRTRNVEQDWSWWRLWNSLGEEERSRRYLHLYDRNKAYFSSWASVELGVAGLRHLEGADAIWDGSEKAGFYRISRPGWGHTNLPDPGQHLGYPLSDGTAWCTVHTLRMLKAHDITAEIHEAYTWEQNSRYLELAAKRLRPLLTNAQPGPVTATVKNLYTNVVGKLGEIDHDPNYHLWRPDWRHLVIGLNKAMILRTISQTGQRTGVYPLLVVGRDTIGYASDNPDPKAAWPGKPDHLGVAPGQWKPAGQGDLQSWGPQHLVKLPGRWRMNALTALTT